MTELFTSGFESGGADGTAIPGAEWTGTHIANPGHTAVISTTGAAIGTKCWRSTSTGGGDGPASCYKSVAPANRIYAAKAKIRLLAQPGGGSPGSYATAIYMTNGANRPCSIRWLGTAGGGSWQLQMRGRDGAEYTQAISGGMPGVDGTYHDWELVLDASNLTAVTLRIYIDGSQVGATFTDPSVTGTFILPADVRFGTYTLGSNYDAYYDDVHIADALQAGQTGVAASLVANTGLWTDEVGNTDAVSLIAAVAGIDSHYLKSPKQPQQASIVFQLGLAGGGNLVAPVAGTRTLRVAPYKDKTGGVIDITINLRDHNASGTGTIRQQFSLTNIDEIDSEIDLTETADPTSWSSVDLEIIANQSG